MATYLEERVKNGIAWMDKVCPDWYKKIDLDELNIKYNDSCVIGQVWGSYNENNPGYELSKRMGFTLKNKKQKNWRKLNNLWKDVIASRLGNKTNDLVSKHAPVLIPNTWSGLRSTLDKVNILISSYWLG